MDAADTQSFIWVWKIMFKGCTENMHTMIVYTKTTETAAVVQHHTAAWGREKESISHTKKLLILSEMCAK